MKKAFLIFSLILILGTLSCGTKTPPTDPEVAPATETTQAPESALVPTQESESVSQPELQGTVLPQTVSVPSGLRVVYIRDGNLWSWTEAGGKAQLTGTGDMSTARVSNDGQLLAFMRGREVWTVGMDGMHARLLSTQAGEGGALWFSSDASLLAVSTKDHIDVVDVMAATSVTVTTYPALPDGYYPEVVWSPDALGFKTVIPSQLETGQAELLFVFTSGTVASLAKFTMIPLSESLPYISPDGGYIIYVAKLGEGNESLYLMDSSGATKPYGQPAENVCAYGWLPDAKHFAYGEQDLPNAFLGKVGGPPTGIAIVFPAEVHWVDAERFLALDDGALMLGDLSGNIVPIDSAVQDFDFVP